MRGAVGGSALVRGMEDNPQKMGPIQKILLTLVTGMLMGVCGGGAYVMAMMLLMNLGTTHHDNYEYYGQTAAVALIFVAGVLGFLAPGVVVWYLRSRQRSWQFSLRALLIAMTVAALLLGAVVW